MGHVITLSRQFGTLGRPLAKELADRLGFKFLDPEIIERAAEKMGMDVEELRAYDNQMVIKNQDKTIAVIHNGIIENYIIWMDQNTLQWLHRWGLEILLSRQSYTR